MSIDDKTIRRSHHKNKLSIGTIILCTILIVYCIMLIFPLLWGFWTSFKTRLDYSDNPIWIPKQWTFTNYTNAWKYFYVTNSKTMQKTYLETMLLNTILYAFGCAFFSTFVPFLVAYLTTSFNYKFSKIIDKVVLVVMIIPIVGALPSEILMSKRLGFYDHIWGIWLMSGTFLGMYYLVFSATFKSIPKEFSEAAAVDGASNTRIMFRVIMPLALSTFSAVFLLKFISYWNEYQNALVFIPSYPTLASGLLSFDKSSIKEIQGVPAKMAGCMVLCVPIFTVFMCFKNKVMGNLTLGGVKG